MTLRNFMSATVGLLLMQSALSIQAAPAVEAKKQNLATDAFKDKRGLSDKSDKSGKSGKSSKTDHIGKADRTENTDEMVSEDIPETAANKTLPVLELKHARQNKDGKAIRQLISKIKVTALNKNAIDFWRGMAFKCEKRYEEAGVEFDKCTDLSDVSVEGHLQVAETYLFIEQFAQAIKILDDSIKRKPCYDSVELRARCYLAQNMTAPALRDFIAAAKMRENKSRSLLARAGEILRREHKPKEALEIMKAGDNTKEHATDAAFYMAKAVCYEDLGQWDNAVESCTRAINVSKQRGPHTFQASQMILSRAVSERAKCYDHLGKPALAKADREFYRKFCNGIEDDMLGK